MIIVYSIFIVIYEPLINRWVTMRLYKNELSKLISLFNVLKLININKRYESALGGKLVCTNEYTPKIYMQKLLVNIPQRSIPP